MLWQTVSEIDQRYLVPWLQMTLNWTTNMFYTIIIQPLQTYVNVEWFRPLIAVFAAPYLLVITASQYTRLSFYGPRRHKNHCTNLRIRRLCISSKPIRFNLKKRTNKVHTESTQCDSLPETLVNLYDSIPEKLVNEFLNNVNVLSHHRLLLDLTKMSLPSRYTELSKSDPRYKRILLEARGLRTSLHHYKQKIPLSNPMIYLSREQREPPIVIDTGASCSVTPLARDYMTTPTVPDTSSMEGLNGAKTEVVGQGTVQWDIQDVHGRRDIIETNAYFMPAANICLFSPQVYIQEQAKLGNTHCEMRLQSTGLILTLGNGTELSFLMQEGNNLPMMLTHKAMNPNTKHNEAPDHKRQSNRFGNLVSFLCSTHFDKFATQLVFSSTGIPSIHEPTKVTDSTTVLQRTNWNLSEPQKELLLWHNRLGHINLQHVQTLLAKPRDKGIRRILKPSNNKSSHCTICNCEACQYAKQKRRNPRTAITKVRSETEGALSRQILIPGQRVSVDLYQSAI